MILEFPAPSRVTENAPAAADGSEHQEWERMASINCRLSNAVTASHDPEARSGPLTHGPCRPGAAASGISGSAQFQATACEVSASGATPGEIWAAYVERALPFHPGVTASGNLEAERSFRMLTEAYRKDAGVEWQPGSPVGAPTVPGLGAEALQAKWIREMFDDEVLEGLLDEVLPVEQASPAGLPDLSSVSGIPVPATGRARDHMLESFLDFMRVATGTANTVVPFPLADGSYACFREAPAAPEFLPSSEEELTRAVAAGDPRTQEAIASSLARLPVELSRVLRAAQALDQGLSGYLAPVNGAELHLAPQQCRPLAPPSRSSSQEPVALHASPGHDRRWGERRRRRTSPAESRDLGCVCGFTCGTVRALERHLARFPGDPAHRAQQA